MRLYNVHITGLEGPVHVHIKDGLIRSISEMAGPAVTDSSDLQLTFEGALAFPGLINSHDHLDFDLFPRTGNRIYRNYIEWGADIQRANKKEIEEILKIPESLRVSWGIYKNLLCGITTVVNHGKKLSANNELIHVLQECHSIHSVDREKNWKFQLNRVDKRKQPVVVHVGEGADTSMQQEIDHLIKWNYIRRDMVGVHGIGMSERQASSFKALVWCPSSNYFLYGKTAPIDTLKKKTTILFGTDSTLTAPWNIWDHLRMARQTNLATDAELFDMLTVNPARIWSMKDTGQIAEGFSADIVVTKAREYAWQWDMFYGLNPEDILLILHRGTILFFDAELLDQLAKTIRSGEFSKIYLNDSCKYIRGDLPGLMKEIRKHNPGIVFPARFE